MASSSLCLRYIKIPLTRLCLQALQPTICRSSSTSTSRTYSLVAGNSDVQSSLDFRKRRQWSQEKTQQQQQQQRQFASSQKSQPEIVTATTVDDYDDATSEDKKHPRAVLSSQALVLKQSDDELSVDELALKAAIQQHEAVLNATTTKTSTKEEDRIKKIIISLQNLRGALEKLEYWEDALEVEVELESYARSALEMAECIFRQGKLYVRQQNDVQGHARYQTALEIFTIEHSRNSGSNNSGDVNTELENTEEDDIYHADIGNVIVAMAGVHFSQGDIDECLNTLDTAEDHFRRHGTRKSDHKSSWFSLSKSSSNNIEPHIDLVKCLDNQGMMYRFKEDFYAALEKYEEALEVLGGRDDTKRLALQMHIAEMLKCIDDIDGAISYYTKILQEDRERRGSDEETVLDGVILQNLGTLHSQQRQLELAEQEMTQALEIQKRFLGENNQEVAATLIALGSVHGVQGHKRQALECFQQALLIERIYAEDDNEPQILHILRNIAVLHGEKVPKWDV